MLNVRVNKYIVVYHKIQKIKSIHVQEKNNEIKIIKKIIMKNIHVHNVKIKNDVSYFFVSLKNLLYISFQRIFQKIIIQKIHKK